MSTNRYDIVLNQNIDIRNTIRLSYISASKFGGDWHSTPHTHNCAELFFITGGQGHFQIEDQIHSVKLNDLVIVNPNVMHTEVSIITHPLEYVVLGIEGFELSSLYNQDCTYRIINCNPIRNNILFYLQHMQKELERKSENYEIVCQDLMEILIILILRQTELPTTLSSKKKKSTHLCSLVRRYIDTHYKENITLNDLVELTHVSKYYMVHVFTEEYGISPINYMISCRIKEARHLLKNDDYSLSFISRILGFSSPSYFSQCFKKLTGMSPNAYRKQSQQSFPD